MSSNFLKNSTIFRFLILAFNFFEHHQESAMMVFYIFVNIIKRDKKMYIIILLSSTVCSIKHTPSTVFEIRKSAIRYRIVSVDVPMINIPRVIIKCTVVKVTLGYRWKFSESLLSQRHKDGGEGWRREGSRTLRTSKGVLEGTTKQGGSSLNQVILFGEGGRREEILSTGLMSRRKKKRWEEDEKEEKRRREKRWILLRFPGYRPRRRRHRSMRISCAYVYVRVRMCARAFIHIYICANAIPYSAHTDALMS